MPPRNRIEVPCAQCGEILQKTPYEIAKNTRYFCNLTCYNKFKLGQPSPLSTLIEVACEICGKLRKRTPKYLSTYAHHYCSKQCAGAGFAKHHVGETNPRYSRVPVNCFNCGNDLTIKQSDYKVDSRYYCSSKCQGQWISDNVRGPSHPLWKGGKFPYYGISWVPQRRMARERDNFTCQHCGITEDELGRKLDVHHIKPFRLFGIENHFAANALDNLIALCPQCHIKAEPR